MRYVVLGLDNNRVVCGDVATEETLDEVVERVESQFWNVLVFSEEEVKWMNELLEKHKEETEDEEDDEIGLVDIDNPTPWDGIWRGE